MRLLAILFALLAVCPGAAWPASVDAFFMTASAPPASSSCAALRSSLPPSESVQATAPRVFFFYFVSDLHTGDTVSTRYFKPDRSTYPNAGSNQPAYKQDMPFGCWLDEVRVAGTDLANSPGVWKAEVLVNGTVLSALDFTVLGGPVSPPTAAKVVKFILTKTPPSGGSSCAALSASLPPATSFSTAEPTVYVFYHLTALARGDVVGTQYFAPDGSAYRSAGGNQAALAQNQAVSCWWDELRVAGTGLANAPGNWTAKLLVNGAPVASLAFTVLRGGETPPQTPVVQGIRYRVENFVYNAPDVFQNPRNYHDFVIDFATCSIRELNQESADGRERIHVSVCRDKSRLTFTTSTEASGSLCEYDWVFLDNGRTISGAYRHGGTFGPSVGGIYQESP